MHNYISCVRLGCFVGSCCALSELIGAFLWFEIECLEEMQLIAERTGHSGKIKSFGIYCGCMHERCTYL